MIQKSDKEAKEEEEYKVIKTKRNQGRKYLRQSGEENMIVKT